MNEILQQMMTDCGLAHDNNIRDESRIKTIGGLISINQSSDKQQKRSAQEMAGELLRIRGFLKISLNFIRPCSNFFPFRQLGSQILSTQKEISIRNLKREEN